jgi:hypothetical protein
MTETLNPVDAEMSVLYGAFYDPRWTNTLPLKADDFYDPLRGELWATLRTLHAENITPDPAVVIERLKLTGNKAERMSNLLVDVVTLGGVGSNTEAHAKTVTDRALRRQLNSAVAGAQQRINDLAIPVDAAVAYVERELVASRGGEDREAGKLMTFDEFINQPLPPIEWVIPQLLATDERIVLTGTEGAGKTTLMRTIGVMVAAGLDPFTLRTIPAKRVLYVDCENPTRIMINRFTDLGRIAGLRHGNPTGLFIRRFPEGIDLGNATDRMKLRYMCQAIRPELLLIGPAYKLYLGGAGAREEDLARIVASALDGLREEFKFALILEHHIPKGTTGQDRGTAPIGSSLWMRWPEFGLGLKLDKDSDFHNRRAQLVHWRGPRDERPWPQELVSGGPNELPWIDQQRMRRSA